jgi:hypothetical protein
MGKGGWEYRRLIAAFERIFGATMFFGTDSLTAKAKVVHRLRFNFFRQAQIWYNRAADESVFSRNVENVIVLSDEFFQEVMAHPITTDLEAVKLLTSHPEFSIYSCGSRIVASLPRARNRFRSSVTSGWSDRLERPSTLVRDGFAKNSRNGSEQFDWSGRSVLR